MKEHMRIYAFLDTKDKRRVETETKIESDRQTDRQTKEDDGDEEAEIV